MKPLGYSGPKRWHWHDHDEMPGEDEPIRGLWDTLHATCVPIFTPEESQRFAAPTGDDDG
jgi:hypothetical protein